MRVAQPKSSSLVRSFLGQLLALGVFARIVQILAILCLLNLNDYFTTAAQIPVLLPVGTLIILLLVLVAIADSVSTHISQRLIERLARIQQVYGDEPSGLASSSTPVQQRHYLRTIFFPLLTAVPPAPLLVVVLVSSTPLLFVISVLQGTANAVIVYYYNRRQSQPSSGLSFKSNISGGSAGDGAAYLLRRTETPQSSSLDIGDDGDNESGPDLRRKKEVLRASNLFFRGLILVTSAVLAIYKLSSLSSVVGFFILNNTLRYASLVLAEYCWPPFRHLSFRQACEKVGLALQPEENLLQRLQNQQDLQIQSRREFDQRMAPRLALKPYLRFKDFRLIGRQPLPRTILDGITARIELLPITLIHVQGASLADDLATLIAGQDANLCRADCQGIAVCGQLSLDLTFWRQLPIADVQHNRVVGPSLAEHFSPEHQARLARLVLDHEINRYYLEGDPQPTSIQHLSRRQIRRMRALMSLLDAVLNPHCLWLLPFVLEPFEESESRALLDIYRREVSPEQRSLFLLSRPLQPFDEPHCSYELRRSSLKRCS